MGTSTIHRFRKRRPGLLLGGAFAVCLAASLGPVSEASAQTATIRGWVATANGTPVADVDVYLLDEPFYTISGPSGAFVLEGVPAGPHQLDLRKLGLAGRSFRFVLTENHLGEIDLGALVLEIEAIEIEGVTVRNGSGGGRLDGYYARVERGFGDFITRETIERLDPRVSSDLLRSVAGLEVRCRGTDCQVGLSRQSRPLGQSVIGGSQIPDIAGLGDGASRVGRVGTDVVTEARDVMAGIVGRTTSFCPVDYFVDGVPFDSGRGIDGIAPRTIEGMEIYKGPANVPARYARHGGACGVILIWTRRPGH